MIRLKFRKYRNTLIHYYYYYYYCLYKCNIICSSFSHLASSVHLWLAAKTHFSLSWCSISVFKFSNFEDQRSLVFSSINWKENSLFVDKWKINLSSLHCSGNVKNFNVDLYLRKSSNRLLNELFMDWMADLKYSISII